MSNGLVYDGKKRRVTDTMTQDEIDDEAAIRSFEQCPAFGNHIVIATLHDDLRRILAAQNEQKQLQEAQAAELKKVAEILEAWNNAKGFVKTVRMIGEVSKWLVLVGGAMAVIWYFLHNGTTPPTK